MTVTTAWSEDAVLAEFWRRVIADLDRLELLQQMADIALERATEWDYYSVRSEGVGLTLSADRCFCCRSGDRHLYWHHIIQVQHGGSNAPSNLVAICHRCHRTIHPWLPAPTSVENKCGWTVIGDMAGRVATKMARALPSAVDVEGA